MGRWIQWTSRAATGCAIALASQMALAQQEQEIVFDEPVLICVAENAADKEVINRFARQLYETRVAMGTNLLAAIDNFETTMSFASDYEAEPQYAEKLLDAAIKETVGALVKAVDKAVPGVDYVAKGIEAVHAEAERAATARASRNVGAWIKAQREVVANQLAGGGQTSGGNLEVVTSVSIQDAIMADLCALNESGQWSEGVTQVASAEGDLRQAGVPPTERYLQLLFEDYIRANFAGMSATTRTPGTVRIFWEADIDGDRDADYTIDWDDDWSAEVVLPSPYGDRVAGGLNDLGISPLATHVVRQVCFETEGIAGGTATYCGALNENGSVRDEPITPWATRAFNDSKWRDETTRFQH